MIGPVLAAIVLATAGVSWAFALNAVSYLAPILSILYLRRHGLSGSVESARRTSRQGTVSAAAYVRDHGWVLALLAGIIACSAPLEVLRTLSPALTGALGQPESAAGLLVAAQSGGSALAILAFIPLRRMGRPISVARAGLAMQAVGLVAAFASRELWQALPAVATIGFGFSLCFPILTSALQEEVPDAVRGRVMSFHQMSHLGNRPFAALAAGAAATIIGAQPAILVALVLIPFGWLATQRAWRSLASERSAREAGIGAGSLDPALD
jgi:hypothetical protein